MTPFSGFHNTSASPCDDIEGHNEEAAKQIEKHGLTADTMQSWLYEIVNQPRFRAQMDEDCDYYDGNQIKTDILEALKDRGQAPLVENLIGPIIDVVAGMEAKARSDWKVSLESGETNQDLTEALSFLLHKAEVGSRADKAISDAYKDQIGPGLGWVYIGKNQDPLDDCPYKVERVHRREIFWDWRSKRDDMADARYLIRKRRVDADVAISLFPQCKEIVTSHLSGNQTRQPWDFPIKGESLNRDVNLDRTMNFEEFEWFNTTRNTVLLYEVWYRQMVSGKIIKLNGKPEEFDENNIIHVSAAARGHKVKPGFFFKVRHAFWVANKLVYDGESPYSHRHFPYVRFYGYKEDKTGVYYGMIRRMRSPQDEVNARKTKMLWQLATVRTILEGDAVADHEKIKKMVARPNSYIILNPNRRNSQGGINNSIRIEDGAPLAESQLRLYQDNKQTINQVAGVYQSMLGSDASAKSGVAINSLMEQGQTTTAEVLENYMFSRRLVGEQLLSCIIDDISDELNYEVIIEKDDGNKSILLNVPVIDDYGIGLINDVTKVGVKVSLEDVPASPTFRQQQQREIIELVKSLPPDIQVALLPMLIEGTDLPNRKEISETIKGAKPDAEKEQLKSLIQSLQEQLGQAKQDANMDSAKIEKTMADAALSLAKAKQIAGQGMLAGGRYP